MQWHADAEEDAEFYYNEEEVLAGARGEERTAMLDHFDSLLQGPHSADTNQVGVAISILVGGQCAPRALPLLVSDTCQDAGSRWNLLRLVLTRAGAVQHAGEDPDRFEDAEETEHAESHADGLPQSMQPEQ